MPTELQAAKKHNAGRTPQGHRTAPSLLPELIRETLLIANHMTMNDNFDFFKQKSDRMFPWNTAAIDKTWRSICLDTAALWTKVTTVHHICNLKCGICVSDLPLVRCFLQLERSRSLPLFISAYNLRSWIPSGENGATQSDSLCACNLSILRACAFECQRWNKLAISLDGLNSCQDFQRVLPPQPHFPLLQNLDLIEHCSENLTQEFLSLFGSKFGSSTPLTLSIAGLQWEVTEAPDFPWNRLSFLRIDDYMGSEDTLVSLLSWCFNIVSFTMGGHGQPAYRPPELPDPSLPRITLSQLKELNFEFNFDYDDNEQEYSPATPVGVLSFFNTPNLQSLALSGFPKDKWADETIILLSRLGCSLTKAKLPYYPTVGDNHKFNLLLQSLSSLKYLECYSGDISPLEDGNELLMLLLREEGSLYCIPKLEVLTLSDICFDPALLARVIQTRNTLPSSAEDAGFSPLGEVKITHSTALDSAGNDNGQTRQSRALTKFYGRMLETSLATFKLTHPCKISVIPRAKH
jgi:hypothetical protein